MGNETLMVTMHQIYQITCYCPRGVHYDTKTKYLKKVTTNYANVTFSSFCFLACVDQVATLTKLVVYFHNFSNQILGWSPKASPKGF